MNAITTQSTMTELAGALVEICGSRYVVTDPDLLGAYETDGTMNLRCPFDILVMPGTTEEIAAVLRLCQRSRVPVTPRGGGSGVTGGALPVHGGVVLSMARMNRLVEFNTADGYAVAEAGMITDDLCRAVEAEGWYFPVIPTSSGYSMLGGNVAENAGSIYSCKYGTTRDYVMGLQVVLPDGEVIDTGSPVRKDATGIDLTGLFIGSEGILGIVTRITYRLIRKPVSEVVLLAGFRELKLACDAVLALNRSGLQPAAVELVCADALALTTDFLQQEMPLVQSGITAHLLIELHERSEDAAMTALEAVAGLLEPYACGEPLVGLAEAEKARLRLLRRSIGSAMSSHGYYYRDVDTCIPASGLYEYIRNVEAVCSEYGLALICFGHAMDGNLHSMLLMKEREDQQDERVEAALVKIYSCAVALGGVLSGEHGIGLLQKRFMSLQFSEGYLSLFRRMKSFFDPNGILNPGKVI